MNQVVFLCVLSMLSQLGAPLLAPFRAVMEMVSGESRIFSGESVRLICSVPDIHRSSWNYMWFRGSEQLPQHGQHLILWNMKVEESGKYYCEGVRDTQVGNIKTLQSLPLEINVDGGWVILRVPPILSLVGDTLTVMCRVRGTPPLHEVILYRDAVEVMRRNDLNPYFSLTNLTLKEQGMYSCRASWDIHRRTHSVISADASVQVSEVLSLPVLEIVADNNLIPVNKIKLICHLQYNTHAPAPPIHYYFYKNNNRLGTATSENYDLVERTPGQYSCRAKVPELGISRWSEQETFGQVRGPEIMLHPSLRPRMPWSLVPLISSQQTSRPPAAHPSVHQSTQTPAFFQPTEVSIQTSSPPPKPSQPAPSTLLPTVQSLTQTPAPINISEELSDDTSAESSGDSAESDDMP
ncbi:hypothetical protein PBY51_009712 [Eleginops maclovinus]|uniref:Ig-like domain-containing protein n=1 Tax=Eleginops maclovinus TaxID=56733 RepID=A0AAN8AV66_ELEMC|nr:hypothetical protein PBY51_009712 [Eleginops maclovinus]